MLDGQKQSLSQRMIKRIIFAAGGTGGHIYPAIAVADELKKINPEIEILFIGAKGRIEEKIVPNCGYKLRTIDIKGFKRSLSLQNINVTLKLLKALRESKKILKEFKPQVVFGTGGFVSGPVLRSANSMEILTVIEEGNSYPGISVKWLSAKADKVILNFEETKKYLKRKDNIEIMSYPVRENLKKISRDEAIKYFGLDSNKKTLFVFGGSQGAASINKALLNSIESLTKNNIQIIWQTGDTDFEAINSAVKNNYSVKVLKYIDNIAYAYSAADLVVCRAGISTVMELAGFGIAAVFVPYPKSSENHQEKNAMTLVEKNAAEIINDSELDEKFENKVTGLMIDDARREELKNNIKQFADNNAAAKIADMLTILVNTSKN